MNGAASQVFATPELAIAVEARTSSSLQTALWVIVGAGAFQLAYLTPKLSWLIVIYVFAMVQLTRAASGRRAFYAGFIVGILIAFGQLAFFWKIFSFAAIALWSVYAFWLGLFVALSKQWLKRFGRHRTVWLLPFLWCGLEYFRSELYFLRFSWLSPGFAFGVDPRYAPIAWLGTYGTGFVLVAIACAGFRFWHDSRVKAIGLLAGLTAVFGAAGWISSGKPLVSNSKQLKVAGIQLEFPSEKEVIVWLNQLVARYPEAELLVLSEYTLDDEPPDALKEWCRDHRRFVIVGGKQPLGRSKFYNTAFVISSEGKIAFRQVKSVPIQFFQDGLPAPEQKLWDSPWGRLGICICYDLSYARVTDPLVRMGAQALIVPTMDVADWGEHQHELHARVGPIRAAEYHLPIFRLASSGISQAIIASGQVLTSTPCPGQAAMLYASLPLVNTARLPVDRWLAPISTVVAAAMLMACAIPKRFVGDTLANACSY